LSAALSLDEASRDAEARASPREPFQWRPYGTLLCGILALAAVDVVCLFLTDLRLAPWPAVLRLGIPVVLMLGAACYGLTGRSERIGATLMSVGTLLLFTLFAVVFSYLAIRGGWPLADARLAAWDHALGLDWPSYRTWIAEHPWVAYTTGLLYETSVIQILVALLVLGFSGRLAALAELTASLIISAFVSVSVGALLPALGAYSHYGVPDDGIAFYVPDIIAAHSGALKLLDLGAAQGLVVFPSYHTAISIAVIIGCWPVRWLRYPVLLINAILVAGVPVWGGHYFVDVIAGTLLVIVAVVAWRRIFGDPVA
jgi:hypothetical protein